LGLSREIRVSLIIFIDAGPSRVSKLVDGNNSLFVGILQSNVVLLPKSCLNELPGSLSRIKTVI
jgi:hypothetical protein